MKFKNVSNKAVRDLTLIGAGEVPRDRVIKPGDIIDVKNPKMIERMKVSGIYKEVKDAEPKKEKKGGK